MSRIRVIPVIVLAFLLMATGITRATAQDATPTAAPTTAPTAAPTGATITPAGSQYAAWVAAWGQWLFSFPAAVSPGTDATGAACTLGQHGKTFFLAPSYVGAGAVTRACTVPQGMSVLVPVIVVDCSTAEAAPFNGTDASTLSSCAKTNADAITAAHATIDGTAVSNLAGYRVQSGVFTVVFPANNPIKATAGVASVVVDGAFLNVEGLPAGSHTIAFGGTYQSGGALNITYNLTVAAPPVPSS
jgi:hypothetical protein